MRSNDSKRGIKQVSPLPEIDAAVAWPPWKVDLGSNQFHSTNIQNQKHALKYKRKTRKKKKDKDGKLGKLQKLYFIV